MEKGLERALVSFIQMNEETAKIKKEAAEAIKNAIQPLVAENISCSRLFENANSEVVVRLDIEQLPLSVDEVSISLKILKEISSILETDNISVSGGSDRITVIATTNVVPY